MQKPPIAVSNGTRKNDDRSGPDFPGDDGDPLVGHQARYGKQWVWVRLKLKTGDYLLSRGYGRTAEYWAKKASDFQVVDFPPVLQKA